MTPNPKEYRKVQRQDIQRVGDIIDKHYQSLFNLAREVSLVSPDGFAIKTPYGFFSFQPFPRNDNMTFTYGLADTKNTNGKNNKERGTKLGGSATRKRNSGAKGTTKRSAKRS